MSATDFQIANLTANQYHSIQHCLYDTCGIKIGDGKQDFVKSRLSKRLTALRIETYDAYLNFAQSDPFEFSKMIDALTTNKTNFFREIQHFDFLNREVLPNHNSNKLRIWSAACSSGEEPYSIAIALSENIPNINRYDAKILGTDISTKVLGIAKHGEYSEAILSDVPAALRQKYFRPVKPKPDRSFMVNDDLKRMVRLARINLLGDWKMSGPFDVIFCRNVMIYFDKETQTRLVNRFYDLLAPGGYLFVGHAESLDRASIPFKYIQPAVYQK
jgi:chemotaxis protein methyltransferase CheR